MNRIIHLLVGTAITFSSAGALTAQPYPSSPAPYGQGYPSQNYGGQQGYGYGQPGYGERQYGSQGGLGSIIDQLLGNRYSGNDRMAVQRCAGAAVAQASGQYGAQGYGQSYDGSRRNDPRYGDDRYRDPRYGGQAYNGYNQSLRVTAITDVERRGNGFRVIGMLGSGAYGNQTYGSQAPDNLTFRCNVDYNGTVTNIRLGRPGY